MLCSGIDNSAAPSDPPNTRKISGGLKYAPIAPSDTCHIEKSTAPQASSTPNRVARSMIRLATTSPARPRAGSVRSRVISAKPNEPDEILSEPTACPGPAVVIECQYGNSAAADSCGDRSRFD